MVERGPFAGDVEGLVVGGAGGRDEADAAGDRGQRREQRQRLQLGGLVRAAERARRVVPGAEADAVGEEDHVELGRLRGLREADEVAELGGGAGVGLRVAPGGGVVAEVADRDAEPHLPRVVMRSSHVRYSGRILRPGARAQARRPGYRPASPALPGFSAGVAAGRGAVDTPAQGPARATTGEETEDATSPIAGRAARGLPLPSLAAPALGAEPKVLIHVPQANLTSLDPVWTTAVVTRNAAHLLFETLYGRDEQLNPQPQMVEGHRVEDNARRWTMRLRDGLRFHTGERGDGAGLRRLAQALDGARPDRPDHRGPARCAGGDGRPHPGLAAEQALRLPALCAGEDPAEPGHHAGAAGADRSLQAGGGVRRQRALPLGGG